MTLLLASAPQPSRALQLRWLTGATDTTLTQDARCVLVVQADSGSALPSEWRLIWLADSVGIRPVASDSLTACAVDTAKASKIDPPSTPADSAAHQSTAHFCSSGAATLAYYLIDLVGGSHGKLKVVALDPADSTSVIESNEATFNGGTGGDYQPLVLSASSIHQSLQLSVSVVGTDLNGANSLSIAAPNGAWSLPLTITARGDSAMTGVASVAALLPSCEASIGGAGGYSSGAALAADPDIQPDLPESGGCSAQYVEELLLSPPGDLAYEVQPKDFAIAPGFVDAATNRYALHLFYIRHNYWYYQPPNDNTKWHPELDEKNLGHAWTSDFVTWHGPAAGDKTDTTGIVVRAGKFDAFHVWAPTIIRKSNGDPTFYMFYTGVSHEPFGSNGFRNNQRIGVATSTDLNTWTQVDSVVLSAPQIPWVKTNPATYTNGEQQLRDPFVMEYPAGSGHYLMYFVAVDSLTGAYEDMAVGAATSNDLRTWNPLPRPFASTLRPTFQGRTNIVESPHLFQHNGQWWMPYTVGQNEVFFETTTSADPTDTLAAHWSSPVWLRGVSQGHPAEMQYWHASEHLQFSNSSYEWLAAFNDADINIEIKGVYAPTDPGVDSLLLDCPPKPPIADVGDPHGVPTRLRLAVLRPQLGSPDVTLRMELPWRTPARLAVYDVAGRRLTTLVDREVAAGRIDVKWDGTSEGGSHVLSGVYFVRLSCAKGAQVSKLVILR